jgi:hypothetical protein
VSNRLHRRTTTLAFNGNPIKFINVAVNPIAIPVGAKRVLFGAKFAVVCFVVLDSRAWEYTLKRSNRVRG